MDKSSELRVRNKEEGNTGLEMKTSPRSCSVHQGLAFSLFGVGLHHYICPLFPFLHFHTGIFKNMKTPSLQRKLERSNHLHDL